MDFYGSARIRRDPLDLHNFMLNPASTRRIYFRLTNAMSREPLAGGGSVRPRSVSRWRRALPCPLRLGCCLTTHRPRNAGLRPEGSRSRDLQRLEPPPLENRTRRKYHAENRRVGSQRAQGVARTDLTSPSSATCPRLASLTPRRASRGGPTGQTGFTTGTRGPSKGVHQVAGRRGERPLSIHGIPRSPAIPAAAGLGGLPLADGSSCVQSLLRCKKRAVGPSPFLRSAKQNRAQTTQPDRFG